MPAFPAAVVGTGFIGPVHIEGLLRAGVPVIGALGSSAEKSRQVAARWGLKKAYASYAEVLADPEVHVVHLATPNRLHFEQAKQALAAGKHVLCEKPLAMTAAESAELVRLAGAAGRACGVNYNIRYYPLCQEMAAKIRGGELGEIFHVAGSYVQDWLLKPDDFNWRVVAEEGGELRAVADIGTHWLDLVQFVSGRKIEAVCADLKTVWTERQRPVGGTDTFTGSRGANRSTVPIAVTTDDYGAILLRFTGGARGVVWVSQVTAGRKNCLRLEIAGQRAAFSWESERPNELWVGQRDKANELLVKDPSLLSDAARRFADYPGGHNEGFPDSFKQCFTAFYSALASGDDGSTGAFPTFADGHREILLCEAILRSQREARWVDVDEMEP